MKGKTIAWIGGGMLGIPVIGFCFLAILNDLVVAALSTYVLIALGLLIYGTYKEDRENSSSLHPHE